MMSTSNNLNADFVPQTYFTPVAAGRLGKNFGYEVLGLTQHYRSQIDIYIE